MFLSVRSVSLLMLALMALITLKSAPTDACSCMPSHPQTHFCQADYVIIVRPLRKSHRLVTNKIVYKVEIKKSYKMNSQAHKMLKNGRIVTSDSESTCGAHLELGKLYMIAGRTPQLNSCNYVKEYMKMSVIERRGFSGVYRKGCKCQIRSCFSNQCFGSNTSCSWSPFSKCESEFSACMPGSWRTPEGVISKCHWRKTTEYKDCITDP